MKRVFLVGGGTGGHLFAAISIANELESRGFKTYLITDSRCEKYLPADFKIPTKILNIGSISSKFFKMVRTIFNIATQTLIMMKVIWQEKPSLIVGFGGYTTVPALKAARIMGVNIVIHEQNFFMGKVNKYFAGYSVFVAVNFEQTLNLDKRILSRVFPVGNPVRQEIKLCNINRNFNKSPFTILIIGGSQGAKIFDELVFDAIGYLSKMTKRPIKIIQQANKLNHQKIQQKYTELGFECELSDFFYDMPTIYAKAHLMICRAGASTIAELIHVQLPSIMIPLPSSANDHQSYNAKALVAKNCALCFDQNNLTTEILAYEILYLIDNPSVLEDISKNLGEMKSDATKNFADHLISVLLQSE